MSKELCYVIDINENKLSPTTYNKGCVLIRKKKARLIKRLPFVIQLLREQKNTDNSSNICGVDTGSKYTGIAIVSKCKTKNKVLFKGTIQHKEDVKKKMELRAGQRRYRRSHKKYRPARFNNRASSKKNGRIPPSIKTKKDEIIRVIEQISKWININSIVIEDVAIDIRALQEGKKLYKWQYQKSNRLDENIRKAVILRDNCKCMECGKSDCRLEVHHIKARKFKGSNNIENLITLCSHCHNKTKGKEELFEDRYFKMIDGKSFRFDYAQHVMQGKTYLREELSGMLKVSLTNGGETANKRVYWNILKSHSNDACVITGLEVNQNDCNIKDWFIQPLRRKNKIKNNSIFHIKHRDIVQYTKKNGDKYVGYITSVDNIKKSCNFSDTNGKQFKRYGIKRCSLIQRNKSINFI